MKSFFSALLTVVITNMNLNAQIYIPKFDVQGHRGARGLKPENTIPAFLTALEHGVTTIELDVAVSKDKQVFVSHHEPWSEADICLVPDSLLKTAVNSKKVNLYLLTYDEIRQCECGTVSNPKFPEQEKIKTYKPLLSEVIVAVENHIKNFSLYEVDYNIELKSISRGDGIYHPSPQEFSDLVYNIINQYLPLERIVIQSFDFRVLQYWHKTYPNVRLAALVENLKSVDKNLEEVGFTPSIYSSHFKLLTKEQVQHLKNDLKIRVIPWTVNEMEDMKRLKSWGVDGFITDYPNRAAELGLTIPKKK